MRLFSPPQLQLCCRLQQQLQGCAGGLLSALQSSSLLQKLGVPEGHSSSNSGCSAGSTIWQSQGPLRHMAGRTHKLSLKKANNKASWLAVQQYFKKKLPMPQEKAATQPQQHGPVIETALPPLPSLPEPPLYQKIGRITGPYAVAPQVGWDEALASGEQSGGAVVFLSPRQCCLRRALQPQSGLLSLRVATSMPCWYYKAHSN